MGTNISKQHREDLLDKIRQIRSYIASVPQDVNTNNFLQYLDELTKDVKGKKYGLVFEQHREAIDDILETHTPVLAEQEDLFIDNGGEMNFLIEGDNLAALQLLEKTHKGKIDVIYIDPPYNTGNKDFVYDDNFVGNDDMFRHSKWLSFMEKRLKIAQQLLSSKGVVYISIDDNEQANLKLLCDEVFGERKFVGDIAWQRTYSPRNDSKGISNEKEHVLVYSKVLGWIPKPLPRDEKMDSKYSSPDGDERPWTSSDAFAPSAATHQGMVYAIQHPITGKLIYPYKGACWPLLQDSMLEEMSKWGNYEYKDLNDEEQRAAVCGISVNEVRKGVKAIVLTEPMEIASTKAMEIYKRGNWPKFYFTSKGKGGIRRKTYKDAVKGKIVTNLWPYDEVGHTDEAKKEIAKIFGGEKPFDTPKPTRLIQRVIRISTKNNSTILDFFAGSGTTGHAVMRLNAEDGGHRKFILCTNNENNICRDVTYERLRTVITGKRKDGSENNEHHNASLKYFKIDYIPISDKLYYEYADKLLLHIRELVELENCINFNNNNEIAIVLTDEEMETFVKNTKNKTKVLYRGHDVLLTGEQEEYLRANDIKVNVIPDYYYNELNK